MRTIALTQGKFVLVDDRDYSWLSQWKWFALHTYNSWYALRYENGKYVRMHRLILGADRDQEVDHVNGNGLDNQRFNLRLCTRSQNQANAQPHQGHKTSRFKGVQWFKQTSKWRASITVNGRGIHLGYFLDEIEAAKAYDRAARQYFEEFAYINFRIDALKS